MKRVLSASFAAILAASTPVHAQTLQPDLLANGFSNPVWVGSYPGDERIFVVEQGGLIKHFVEGQAPVTFLNIDPQVLSGGERGLLGMAFHPKFPQNGYFFVNYTNTSGGDTVISRFQVSATDPDVADPTSEVIFRQINQPFSNHNAGDLAFSPVDGYLYIPVGDGGSGNDPGCRSQDLSKLQGKMLRIDVDNPDLVAGTEYSIPPDNPFIGVAGARPEIWSLGLRNPFRFSFDRLTGDIYIGDVGQNSREEISFEPALTPGTNFGWPVMEADECKTANFNDCNNNEGVPTPACFSPDFTDPIYAYDLYVAGRCSVMGGVVYRGCEIPALQGTYFFADYCGNDYWSFVYDGSNVTNFINRTSELVSAGNNPTDFGEDGNGEILIATHNGRISRIVPVSAPSIADCDADGQDDDCEMATYPWADMDGSGTLDSCESLDVDTDNICVSTGGTQTFNLHAGAGNAGAGYLVMGSFAGTSPGTPLGAAVLPLNFDFYTVLSVQLANGVPFNSTFGILDGNGDATASFEAPAGLLPNSVVGTTANHAYVLLDGGLNVTFASNYTGLEFRP